MSNEAYQELLDEVPRVFDETLPQEEKLQKWAAKLKKIKNPREAHITVYSLYAKYVKIVNNLEQCYDQMLQPQKRVALRVLLDASIGRMLEMKDELVKMDMSDFNYNDDALAQLRLTPCDLELRVPRYIAREREAERLERRKLMDEIYLKLHPPIPTQEELDQAEEGEEEEDEEGELEEMTREKAPSTQEEKAEKKVPESAPDAAPPKEKAAEEKPPEETGKTPEGEAEAQAEEEPHKGPKIWETATHRRQMFAARAAERENARQEIKMEVHEKQMEEIRKSIFLIQVHERARQARYKHQLVHNVGNMRGEEGQKRMTQEEKDRREQAALKIQHCWIRYCERRKQRHRDEQQNQLLWMVRKNGPLDTTQQRRAEEVCRLRYGTQDDFQEDYEYSMAKELEQYEDRQGPWLQEQYIDEVRNWFREWYAKIKNFPPEYPKEEDGGSLMIAEGRTIAPEVWLAQHEREEAEKAKKGKQKPKSKEQIRQEQKKAMEKAKKQKLEAEKKRIQDEKQNPGFKMEPSNYLPILFSETEKYNEVWRNKDESGNREQRYDVDMLQQDKHLEVQLQVRKIVDQLMQVELEQLKVAVQKDIARSLGKRWRRKKHKKKKPRVKKPPRPKPDLTGDRSLESLIEELMEAGILVHPIPDIRVDQLAGEYSYSAYEKRLLMQDPAPAVGDMKNLVYQYCILPFGSPLIRHTSPLIKSVCIIGPRDSGKHMLVNAICTETGAYLFDISPEIMVGKYEGRSGTIMFNHLMNKMTRLLQPAVVFIDGAEKPFYKRVPKEERHFHPKRLAKWLPKFVKGITADDQVMLIGTTHQPWACSPKKLTKLYNKLIFIPRTDYGTSEAVWQEHIMRNHLVKRDLDLSALARVTTGLPVGVIKYLVQKVLSRKRILELPFNPLTISEVLEASLKYDPVDDDEFEKFLKFFSKHTKLGKKRAQFFRDYLALQEKLAKAAKSKKH